MRQAYFVEILRARLPIVVLAIAACTMLRMALDSAQEGEWVASEGQGLASIVELVLILPVLALVTGRVRGELGADAWMLARPISRNAIVGLRVLADACVLVLAALVAWLSLGDMDAAVIPSRSLKDYANLVAAWWGDPLAPDALFDRSYGVTVAWGPIGAGAVALVSIAYCLGLLSGVERRGSAVRALGLGLVLAASVSIPFVVLGLADAGDLLRSHRSAWWRTFAVAWVATAPVVAVLVAVCTSVVDLMRRPSAVRLSPIVAVLAAVSLGGAAIVLACSSVAG